MRKAPLTLLVSIASALAAAPAAGAATNTVTFTQPGVYSVGGGPQGAPTIHVTAIGERGANGGEGGRPGGLGARVTGDVVFPFGAAVFVGVGVGGGAGGPGGDANPERSGGAGGGASDVRSGPGLAARLLVAAGGGGGGGSNAVLTTGAAGGAAGQDGQAGAGAAPGLAGTLVAGGAGGAGSASGADGVQGDGGAGGDSSGFFGAGGGGGGGGYFGGGGGGAVDVLGASSQGGGGGGGSSYTGGATNGVITTATTETPSVTLSFEDAHAPAMFIGSPAGTSRTADATPTVTGQGGQSLGDDADVVVRFYAGSEASGEPAHTVQAPVGAAGPSEWAATPPEDLPDGTYLVQARQGDSIHTATDTVTITVDTAAPSPAITSPAERTNDTTPALTGTAGTATGDASSVTVRLFAGNSTVGAPLQTTVAPVSEGTFAVEVGSPLEDGAHTVEVTQEDDLGHAGVATRTFTVDTVAPAAPLLSAPGLGNDATPALVGTAGTAAGDADTVTVTVRAGDAVVRTLQAAVRPDGTFTATVDPALADGTYTARAVHADAAGNEATGPDATFTIDTAAPDTTITGGPGSLIADRAVTLAFSSPEAGAAFACSVDGGPAGPCTSPLALRDLGDGTHTVSVAAGDAAGNRDATPATRTFRVDATKPSPRLRKLPRFDRRGRARARLSCEEACRIRVTIKAGKVRMDRATFRLASDRTARKRLKLTKRGRRLLARRGSVKAKIRLVAVDAAGNRATRTVRQRLRAQRGT